MKNWIDLQKNFNNLFVDFIIFSHNQEWWSSSAEYY